MYHVLSQPVLAISQSYIYQPKANIMINKTVSFFQASPVFLSPLFESQLLHIPMAFNNINTQAQHQAFWASTSQDPSTNQSPVYDDIYTGLELNQENMTLFDSQSQQNQHNPSAFQQSHPQQNAFQQQGQGQSQFQNQNDFMNFGANQFQSQYTTVKSDTLASVLFDNDTNLAGSGVGFPASSTSDELLPLGKQVLSPEGSSTSVGINLALDEKLTKKAKSKRQLLDEQDAILIARDDSELTEDELQLKRKAQNRAAQRAFRERKETKLKELESKLLQSEDERQKLMDELDLIRKQNILILTENEILRSRKDGSGPVANEAAGNEDKFTFPRTQLDFIEAMVHGTVHNVQPDKINKVYVDSGLKILAMGAVWDYLQIKTEELDLDFDSLDITEVMNRLRGHEKCHGYGPAYPLDLVNQALSDVLDL